MNRIKIRVLSVPALLLLCMRVWGQHLPVFDMPDRLYAEGLERYTAGHYAAAQERFSNFLKLIAANRAAVDKNYALDEASARGYLASCAAALRQADAVAQLLHFAETYPWHSQAQPLQLEAARIEFGSGRYEQAERILDKLNINRLPLEASEEVRFLQGYCAYASARPKQAIQYFRPLAAISGPFQAKASYFLGASYYSIKDYNSALFAFRSVPHADSFNQSLPLMIGLCLYQLGQDEELGQLLEEGNWPESTRQQASYQFLGAMCNFRQRKFKEAIPYFEGYLNAGGRMTPELAHQLGYSHFMMGNFGRAKHYLQQAAQDGSDSIQQIAAYFLGFSYYRQQLPEEARMAFRRAASIRHDRDCAWDALLQYAKVSFEANYTEDALLALKSYIEEIPTLPRVSEAQALIGEVYLYGNNFAEAITYFEAAKASDLRSQQAYQKSLLYLGLENYQKMNTAAAKPLLEKAAKLSADAKLQSEALFWLGELHFRNGDYAAAAQSYERFAQSAGASKTSYHAAGINGVGWAYYRQMQFREALGWFEKTLRLPEVIKKYPEAYVDAGLRAGDCAFVLKSYAEAVNYYQAVLKMDRWQEDYAMYQIGICRTRQSRYPEAIDMLSSLVKRYRQSAFRDDALDAIAEIYLTWLSDYPKATAAAEQLIREHPNSPLLASAFCHLGTAAYNSNDNQKAIEYYKTVLLQYGNSKDEVKIAMDGLNNLLPVKAYDNLIREYRKKYPIEGAEAEELLFTTGRERFYGENYESAVEQLTEYLVNFPNGKYVQEALLLRADAYLRMNFLQDAVDDYMKIIAARPDLEHTIKALENAAEIELRRKYYDRSLKLYRLMDTLADSYQDKLQAQFGIGDVLLAKQEYESAKVVFDSIRSNPNTTGTALEKAALKYGYAIFGMGIYDSALVVFEAVEEEAKNELGAEAQYMIAKTYRAKEDYMRSKNAIFYLKDNYPTYAEWRARAFLLLAENYLSLGDKFQATETFKSLVQNSPYPEIKNAAIARMKELGIQLDKEGLPFKPESKSKEDKTKNKEDKATAKPDAKARPRTGPGVHVPTKPKTAPLNNQKAPSDVKEKPKPKKSELPPFNPGAKPVPNAAKTTTKPAPKAAEQPTQTVKKPTTGGPK